MQFRTLYSEEEGTLLLAQVTCYMMGHAMAQLVETLRYKPEGLGFDSSWDHWNFSLT